MGAGAGKLTGIHDQILFADWPSFEEALQYLADAGGVAGLSGERSPGGVRCHAVPGHRAPGMILRRWLRKPNVTGVTGELPAFQRPGNRIPVADLAPRCIDQVRAALQLADQRIVEEVLCFRM